MNPPKSTSCPFCHSPNIRQRHRTHDWRCERCGELFPRPHSDKKPHSGSGQFAGLSYRHQLARDILNEHERSRK